MRILVGGLAILALFGQVSSCHPRSNGNDDAVAPAPEIAPQVPLRDRVQSLPTLFGFGPLASAPQAHGDRDVQAAGDDGTTTERGVAEPPAPYAT